jgi:dephospho-CoA kinase
MLLVGLTGGLGAGKSTVGRMLARRDAVVIDADDLAREALAPGSKGLKQACDLLGDSVLTKEGELDRRAVAEIVFADEEKRRALESITHPEVFRLLAEEVERHRGSADVVVFDAPLIIETGFNDACDVVVVVSAPVEAQIARVVRDRRMTEAQARARIAAQLPADRREAAADVIIQNDGDLASLKRQVDELWTDLRARARKDS